ncbi:glycogen/starch/alpha-glucan phosphorylase [Alkaliphilus serpentinus]|uniref:Alpha-1,4 glucan phosphorylase n=1 Tax=Alkaliphilus serpentinus TaxID=1482731 RepID=A0A833HPP9_9FIRM|nr:glycogen/starch/alpha-glucan phosphorylase [Alkaliphilus serpentinus]KAB3531093.1 glycogen/starch/alpha-glucan phosphorylase [Alkaliphilus serpentinus]
MINKKRFIDTAELLVKVNYGKTLAKATPPEKYYAISRAILEQLIENWSGTTEAYSLGKEAYYLSAEFLMGRAFSNNLINLGIYNDIQDYLKEINIDINAIEEAEADAALGNGGLGRLAACFLDSCATLNFPVTGYGIYYNYGIFKQTFSDGFQIEEADTWLKDGNPWGIRKEGESVVVEFSDQRVRAVPYDLPIVGYETKNINTLRLWQAEALEDFNYTLFNDQKYHEAVAEKNRAEDISRVLYPNDSTEEGKILRLKQQYFFVSASLKDIVKKYKRTKGDDFSQFHLNTAIQLNDTHPVVAIPELLRILMEEDLSFKVAWGICQKTFAYTNHTILAEALEQWDCGLFERILPRIYSTIKLIDKELLKDLSSMGYPSEKIKDMQIISNNRIRMAFLAIYGNHTTNGVAALHTEILKNQELSNWYNLYPERFQNKTNGITPRRWLALSNRELTQFIISLMGDSNWLKDLERLKSLETLKNHEDILDAFMEIKEDKKRQLSEYILQEEGIGIDTNFIFDIQIKRLHEYKRQLLNAFHILDLYYRIKENPKMDLAPRAFIFGAKAAPGYFRAKGIIKFINEIAGLINNDPEVQDKLRVVFVQNYRVTYAEKLFPAADVSEQISTAGKEASGTGNMKFMLNGTPTLGTPDGANVEIVEEAGEDNNFIFGARVEELDEIKDTYDPIYFYENVQGLKRVVDSLIDGTFDDGGTGMFLELYNSLLKGASWHSPDHYFILKDFDDYRRAQMDIDKDFRNKRGWAKKCWINLCNAGKFSSDRTIREYARDIWNIREVTI